MKESIKDYLREIEQRDQQAEQVKYDANAAEEENAAVQSTEKTEDETKSDASEADKKPDDKDDSKK